MRNQMLANLKQSTFIGKSMYRSVLMAAITGCVLLDTSSVEAQSTPVPSGRSTLGSPYPRANSGQSRTRPANTRPANDQPIILSEFAIPQSTVPRIQAAATPIPATESPTNSKSGAVRAEPPAFVWLRDKDDWSTQLLLRKVVKIDGPISGTIQVSSKNPFQVFCNGRVVGEGDSTSAVQTIDVTSHLRHGDNVIAVQAKRETADAPGVGLRFLYNTSLSRQTVETDSTWLAAKRALPLWKTHLYSDRSWTEAAVVKRPPAAPTNLPTQSPLPIPTRLTGLATAEKSSAVSPTGQSNASGKSQLAVVSGEAGPAVPTNAVAMNFADQKTATSTQTPTTKATTEKADASPAASKPETAIAANVPAGDSNATDLTSDHIVANSSAPAATNEASTNPAVTESVPEMDEKVADNKPVDDTAVAATKNTESTEPITQVPSIEDAPADEKLAEKVQERIYPATDSTALATVSADSATTEETTKTSVQNTTGMIAAETSEADPSVQTAAATRGEMEEPAVAKVGYNGAETTAANDDAIKLRVPEGFVVEPIAASDIGSLIAIEFDEFGRLIASKEQGGLVRIDLTVPVGDPNRVKEICSDMSAVQGILPLNGSLFVTGLGPEGLGVYRLDDSDGDFSYETVNLICSCTGEPGEHGPHAINLGSDRMLYVLLGNHSQVEGEFSDRSLLNHFYEGDLLPRYEDPSGHAAGIKSPGGTLIRMSLDGSQKEVVAAGIRNAYDFAFNESGEIFFHDSDMESDAGTSWYRPTALHHLIGGADYGWRSGWAKWRSYYADSIAPIAVTGRSSPSGCAFYQHVQFPAEYQNRMFLADWSNGRIVSVDLEADGATYKANLSTFMEGRPLNVTDLSVGPEDGALYVALGGRASTGGVYRVRWTGKISEEQATYGNDWEEVIRSPLFYSAASRQRIATLKQKLSASWDQTMRSIITSEKNVDAYRIRALDILQWFGPTPDLALLQHLKTTESIAVRAKVATVLGTLPSQQAVPELTSMMLDASPLVQRCVCESLCRLNAQVPVEQVIALMDSPDRTVAYVAGRLLEKQPVDQWQKYLSAPQTPDRFVRLAITTMTVQPDLSNAYAVLVGVTKQLDAPVTDTQMLDLIRVTQLSLAQGKVDAEKVPALAERLSEEFPSDNNLINRELVYTLAYLKAASISDRYSAYLKDESIAYVDRWHLAMHLQTMGAALPATLRADMIQFLEASRNRDAGGSYAHYVMQATRSLAANISEEDAEQWIDRAVDCPNAALIALGKLGRPLSLEMTEQLGQLESALADQNDPATKDLKVGIVAVLGETLTDADAIVQVKAAEILEGIWQQDPNRRQWVALAMSQCPMEKTVEPLPTETNAALRLASQARTTLLPVEAKPVYANRFEPQLIRSLPYLSGATAGEVLACLEKLPTETKNPENLRNIILIGVRYPEAANASHQILSAWTGQVISTESNSPVSRMVAWQSWFAQRFPNELPAEVPSSDDAGKWTVAEIEKQLSLLKPDLANGLVIYREAKCASCHKAGGMGSSVGPDLNLVSGRFTQREIIEAIVHPSQVISDQYRSDLIQTDDGRMITGIVSQLPGGRVAVLDSEGKRSILNKIDIVEVKRSTQSIMPTQLMDSLNAQEVVDLIGFLESEKRPQVATESGTEEVR